MLNIIGYVTNAPWEAISAESAKINRHANIVNKTAENNPSIIVKNNIVFFVFSIMMTNKLIEKYKINIGIINNPKSKKDRTTNPLKKFANIKMANFLKNIKTLFYSSVDPLY